MALHGHLQHDLHPLDYAWGRLYVGDSDWLLKETKYPSGGAAFDLVQYRYISPKLMRIVLRDGGACNIVNYLQMNWHGDFYRWYSANSDSFTVQQGDEWGVWLSTPLACGAPHAYHWNAQWGYQFFVDLSAPNGTDPQLGLYYVHGRWYNPEVGLFLSPDEKGEYFYGSGQDAANWAWARLQTISKQLATLCDSLLDCEDLSAISEDLPGYFGGAGYQFFNDQAWQVPNFVLGTEWQQRQSYAFYRGQQGGRLASSGVNQVILARGITDVGTGFTTGGLALACELVTEGICSPLAAPAGGVALKQILIGTGESIYSGGALFFAAKNPLPSGKPVTPDEKRLIGRISEVPRWLREHPDLAADAKIVNNGGQLPRGANHVAEAEQRIQMLNNAIDHLQRVRSSRSEVAQSEIDAAIVLAQQYRQMLFDILSTR